jgi:peptidoglycan/xylan/chitin deacetylase (PgdA/CDA1 family)
MAEHPTGRPDLPGGRRDDLLARRARQRRQLRRRRLGAAGALATVAVVALALALGGGGGGDHAGRHLPKAPARHHGGHASAGRVRNSTPQRTWRPYTGPVPILEYHVLGPPPPEAPYPELFVERSDFRAQLGWLARHGYQAVTLEQVERAWYQGGRLPPKPVVLSFDDGYRPQFTFALPALRRHGWAGVLNLKAEGSDLYHSDVETMIRAGWELAAHTIHHLDLTELSASQLREEVAGSRAILRREYGVPVRDFCYPAGRFDPTVVAAVEAGGYAGATTEVPGYASRGSPYELDRFEILRSSGVAGLAAALRSGP